MIPQWTWTDPEPVDLQRIHAAPHSRVATTESGHISNYPLQVARLVAGLPFRSVSLPEDIVDNVHRLRVLRDELDAVMVSAPPPPYSEFPSKSDRVVL